MHELSLAGSILDIVETAARRDPFARVRRLHLSVPSLAGVEVDALRFALQSVAPRTLLEGAEVVVDEPDARAECKDCGRTIAVRAHEDPCPHCGGYRWRAMGDTGMRVVDLLVE